MRPLLVTAVLLSALAMASPAWSAPVPGLVAAYSLDEGSGTSANDTSGNGHTGTVVGGTWAPGRYGGAISLDGVSNYVNLGALGTFYTAGFTLEAWVQKRTATKNDAAVLGTWTGNATGGPMIWVDHLATHYMVTFGQTYSNYLDSGQSPVAGQWQHLAATYDGTTARFYINGTQVASRTVSPPVGSSNLWRIGAYDTNPGGFFDGLVDDVRIYNRALSATEIQTDMNTPLGISDTTAPTMPGNFATTSTTTSSIGVQWSASTDDNGVSGYRLYRDGTQVGTTSGTTFTFTGLSCSTTYALGVEAYDASGNTSSRATQSVTTAGCAGAQLVAAYAFDDGSGSVATDASGNGHPGTIVGASWTTGRYGGALSFNGNGNYVNLGQLGTFYTTGFTLEAWVQKTSATKGDTAVVGSWAWNAGGGPMIWTDSTPHYRVTLGNSFSNYLDSGQTPVAGQWQYVAATYDGSTARFYVNGVQTASSAFTGSAGGSNTWRIGAYDSTPVGFFDGLIDEVRIYNGTRSTAQIQADMATPVQGGDTTPPSAPATLTATGGASSATLNWSAATDDIGVVKYDVYRSTTSGFTPSTANRIAQPTGITYTDNVAAGTYYYKVAAEDAAGNIGGSSPEASATVADTTPPSAPGTLTATGAIGTASLSWGAATDDVGVVRYNVYRSTTAGFVPGPTNLIAQPTGTTYSDTITPGTYFYKVTAQDAAGNAGPASNEATATVTTDTTPPSAPTGLAAPVTGSTANLTWTASTDNVGVVRYDVYRSTTSGFTPSTANRIAQPTGTSYSDSGLAIGTYYYKVTAEDAAANISSPSNEASGTVADATPPSAPGGLAATVAATTANLTWTASTDNMGVVRYNVHRSTTSGFTPSTANRIAQPTGTSYSDTGLGAGTYYYKVTAEDAAGNVSAASNQATATIAGDTTPPTVAIMNPADGASASNIVTISATAQDNQAVAGVQFRLDGQNAGAEDQAAPYSYDWDTRGEINGSHTITAVARDSAGNTAVSAPVHVTVSNAGVSTQGLKVAYALDDGSGNLAVDTSGNYATGTLVNAGWSTAGKFGGAVSLSGSAEVDPPAQGTFYTSGLTLEAWVYRQTSKNDDGIVGTWVGSQGGGPMLWIDGAGHYRLTLGSTLSNYLDSGQTAAVGQWQHVAATFDGSQARFYVNGVLTASSTFTGNVGSSNTWRIGAYNATPEGFFPGRIDNVRIYSRPLTASEIQVDMASRIQPDQTSPTVTTTTPASAASQVSVTGTMTAKFSEPMRSSTINGTTFTLKDAANNAVPASVSYDSATATATLTPSQSLDFSTTYQAVLSTGASDLSGNGLASAVSWSFTTESAPPPVLVVGSTANPFTTYLGEILRTEGLNEFTSTDISLISPSLLSHENVIVLGDMTLSPTQVTMLSNWVSAGGTLIAMHPDKQLAGLLGLTDAGTTLANAYLKVDTTTAAGAGIVGATIQYHGTADRYTLNGATAIAALYSDATTATPSPAVSWRAVGTNGGKAIAFTYDLARSIAYTRQGNPAWVGQNRDNFEGIAPDDLYYGARNGDVQPDWVNTSKIAIPQADEQQRLLVNLITVAASERLPLPRFWYLPRGAKAALALTSDDHSTTNAPGGTAYRFDRLSALSTPGCVVANWECLRATSFIYPVDALTSAQANSYVSQGFELALHPVFGQCPTTVQTYAQISATYAQQLSDLRAKYTGIPVPATNRNHCYYWPDWSSIPKIELANGVRMDFDYAHYPNSWIGGNPGFMTGSGFPMRFADTNGTPIDVYQEATHLDDDGTTAAQTPAFIASLLDNAVGSPGYYGAFGVLIHADNPIFNQQLEDVVAAAKARNVPIVSGKQLLDWTDGRNNSTLRDLQWNAGTLTFTVNAAAGANGLQTMVPTQGPSGTLAGITRDGLSVAYTVQTIKGISYAMFDSPSGAYVATYN